MAMLTEMNAAATEISHSFSMVLFAAELKRWG
jgi:hypothetical protein